MNVLVGYFSETGNTKRVAEAMGEEAATLGHEVHIKTVGEVTAGQLNEYSVVLLGSTCHSADIAAPVRNLLDGIPADAKFKLAGFVTHATTMPEGDDWKKEMYKQWAGKCEGSFTAISQDKGVPFLGYFHCQGVPNPPIAEFIHSTIVTDASQWDEYIAEVEKHPTAKDLEAAKGFVRGILEAA
ncbi:flavodoxin family protein [Candidatus Bipolaricaulota bacterium]